MKLGATCSPGAALQCGGCGLVCMRGSHGRLPSRPPVLRPLCGHPPAEGPPRRICWHFPAILQTTWPNLDFFQLLIALTHFWLQRGQFDRHEGSFLSSASESSEAVSGQRPLRI